MQKDDRIAMSRAEGFMSRIECRLGCQVRGLRVEMAPGGRVILHGRTTTYHAKQWARLAVLDLLDEPADVLDDIVVC